jgi:phospholipid-binding lipoprotein MlaA
MRQTVLRTSFLALALLLSACSSGPQPQPQTQTYQEPVFTAERLVPEDFEPASAVYDPWEGMNKRIYNFNYHFDQKVFLPVVRGYNFILPGFARTGVHNFFNNFRDVRTMVNSILQLAPAKFFQSTGRVLVNSTVGVLGLVDVATKLDFPRPQEDFGQTLGHWGVGQGPYLVIPFMGPSNLRDGFGLLPDLYVQSVVRDEVLSKPLRKTAFLIEAIDTRANTSFRYYETGSAFEYQMVRWLYSTKRELDVAK